MFDDVVEVAPLFCVVEVAGSFGTHAPDVIELVYDFQIRIRVKRLCGLESAAVTLLKFSEKIGDFGIAAW